MEYTLLKSKYNESVRDLYKRVNDGMNVHPVFTQEILDDELKVPSDTYNKDSKHMYFALYKDKVVGMCCYELKEDGRYEISTLSVDEDYRGQKIGTFLMNLVMNKGPVHLSAFCTNQEAIEFYRYFDNVEKEQIEYRHSERTNSDYHLVHFYFKSLNRKRRKVGK